MNKVETATFFFKGSVMMMRKDEHEFTFFVLEVAVNGHHHIR